MLTFRAFLYIVFALVAAPLEAWAYVLNGLGTQNDKWYYYPWTHGLIYIIAILFFWETLFRISHIWGKFPKGIRGFAIGTAFVVSCVYSVFLFGIYVGIERVRLVSEIPLFDSTGNIQNLGVIFGFCMSVLSYVLIEGAGSKSETEVQH